MTQRKGLRGILALLCAMTLLIGAIGPAWATEAAPLTDGGTQEVTPAPDGNTPAPEGKTPAPDGETPAPAPETPKTIRSWDWVDPNGYLKEGVLKQPDVNAQNPVQFSGVTVFLPKEITAKVEGSEEDVTIPVEGWECLSFGDMSTGGDYTFTAKLGQGYTLKEGVAALEVQVKLGQPVTNGVGDTTGNAAASEVITVESWTWVDSMQALSDDGKLHLTKEITDENLPEIQKLLPQSIQAGEHTISLTWTYSKETKTFTAKLPDGYALKEGALTVAVVVEQVTMLPADGNTVYVGGVALVGSSDNIVYATTNENGEVITEGATADNYNIKWDGSTLTLKGAYITKEVSTPGLSSPVEGAAIGVYNQSGDANLTITLEGTNTIKDASTAIHVFASSGSASLTITGDGILSASSRYNSGIRVQSNTGNGTLAITGAKVTASSSYIDYGVHIWCGDSSNASLTVNGGSLTATGSGASFAGIMMQFGSGGSGTGMPTVTVSGNATVRANGSAGGIASNSSTPIQFGAGPGIVFDGKNGTVYGNVTLQEDLTINEGETLTIPDGASLTTNDKLIVNGGTLNGKDRITGTVKYVPVITTQPTDANVTAGNTAAFNITATGDELTYQWQQSNDSGKNWTDISGATTDTYTTAATTAEMNGYQYHCVVTGKGGEKVTSKAAILTVTSVAVTEVKLNKTATSLAVGNTETLIATVSPESATDKTVTWSSDNEGVAKVDSNGKVTAVSVGTAKITAKAGDKTADCTVTVKQAVTLKAPETYKTTYNGSAVTPAAIPKTATCDGHAVSGTWRFADGNPKNAGTYENIVLEFIPKDKDKYAEASMELDVVIEKKPLTAYVKLSSTKIGQGKKLPTVSLAFSGLVSGEKLDLEVDPKFEGMPSNSKKAGTYTIKLKNVDEMQKAIEKLDVAKNYDLSDLKFTPAKLSIVSSSNPVTADTSNIGLWTAVMVISGIGLIVLLVVMVVLNKKSKRRRSRRRRTPPRQED